MLVFILHLLWLAFLYFPCNSNVLNITIIIFILNLVSKCLVLHVDFNYGIVKLV